MVADDRIERREGEKSEGNGRNPKESVRESAENESFLDEELIPFLILAGGLLFLFPEPATSALGIVLVGIGVLLWITDLIRGS